MKEFLDYASGIRFPDCSKLVISRKHDNDATIYRPDIIVKFFWRCFVSLVKFCYWSKFHISFTTGSGFMPFCFYMELTRNPNLVPSASFRYKRKATKRLQKYGNRKDLRLDFSLYWRLGRVRYTKFGMDVSNKMLLNAAKC